MKKFVFALALLLAPAHASAASEIGMWLTTAEVAALPTTGAAWNNVVADAGAACPDYNFSDASGNVCCLANALHYAKTGNATSLADSLTCVDQVIGHDGAGTGFDGTGNTGMIRLCRKFGTIAVIADLINLAALNPTKRTNLINALRHLRDTDTPGLSENSKEWTARRPNNTGTHCFFSLAAIDWYAGDTAELASLGNVVKTWMGEAGGTNVFSFTASEWQKHGTGCADSPASGTRCYGVNPVGTTHSISGAARNTDGVLPDDQRRGGGLVFPFPDENYSYEALQGALPGAYVLSRFTGGAYPALAWGTSAIKRAFTWLNVDNSFPAAGDDAWQPWMVNKCYGTAFAASSPAGEGKNVGYTDWSHGAGSITSCGALAAPSCPACSNNTRDCGEADIDCGGGGCATCSNGDTCSSNSQCTSNFCNGLGLCDTPPPVTLSSGFTDRACGLDIDHDGTWGEALDDCNVCDGTASAASPPLSTVAAELYVNSGSGVDNSTCGTTGAPCKTIHYALNTRGVANGATIPDIICHTGTATTEPTSGFSMTAGVTGTYNVPGSTFDLSLATMVLPSKPTLVIPWDTNNNGAYNDEIAVIEGCTKNFGASWPTTAAYTEIAHMTFANFGSAACAGRIIVDNYGVFDWTAGAEYVFVHDNVFESIARDQALIGELSVIRPFTGNGGGQELRHAYVINNDSPNVGSNWMRAGVGDDVEDGPLVLAYNSGTWAGGSYCPKGTRAGLPCESNSASNPLGCPGSNCASAGRFLEVWGTITGVYVEHNVLNANSAAWATYTNGTNSAIDINNCCRDVFIRDNDFSAFKWAVSSGPDAGGGGSGNCVGEISGTPVNPPRPITNVNINSNRVTLGNSAHAANMGCFKIGDQSSSLENEHTSGLKVINNYCNVGPTGKYGIMYSDGSVPISTCPRTDTHVIANNTVVGGSSSSNGSINLAVEDQTGTTVSSCVAPTIKVENNAIMEVPSGDTAIRVNTTYVSKLDARNNAATPNAVYDCGGGTLNLAGWQASACTPIAEQQCTAAFVTGDVHVLPSDTCLLETGMNATADGVTVDIDGDARPIGSAFDKGADERAANAVTPGQLQLSASTLTVTEGQPITLTICRVNGVQGTAGVRVRATGGTATAATLCSGEEIDGDYLVETQTLNWAAGEGGCKAFDPLALTCDDSDSEFVTETVTIALDLFQGATAGSPTTATVNIDDNEIGTSDAPTVDSAGVGDSQSVCDGVLSSSITLASAGVDSTACSNRVLVAAVSAEGEVVGGATPRVDDCDLTTATVTWNGQTLSPVTGSFSRLLSSSRTNCTGLFYLNAPSATSANLVAAWPVSMMRKHVTKMVICDASQGGPSVSTHSEASLGSGDLTASANITTIATDSLVIDALTLGDAVTNLVAGAGQTEQSVCPTNADCASCDGSSGIASKASSEAAPSGGVVTMSWAWDTWVGTGRRRNHALAAWTGLSSACAATCGNGVIENSGGGTCTEVCDDGNTTNNDGCQGNCASVTSGWACNTANPTVCTTICRNGIVSGAEQCDDGNDFDGDCCTNTCTKPTCGDGTICSSTACNSSCTPDHFVEQCDAGNDSACSSGCNFSTCICNDPPPALVACCHVTPTFCADQTEINCGFSGGTSQGTGTDCSPDPCPPPTTTTSTTVTTSTTSTSTTLAPPATLDARPVINVG